MAVGTDILILLNQKKADFMLHILWPFEFTDFYFLHLRKYLKGNQFEYFYTIIYQLAQNDPFFRIPFTSYSQS